MTPYFIIFGCLAALAFIDLFNIQKDQKTVALLIVSLVLILFAGLRYGGPDYIPYEIIFNVAKEWNFDASADIGYAILNGLLSIIWGDPLIVFFTVAAISVSINIRCFNEYGKYAFVAILFYFVHSFVLKEMIQIRAGLACAIGLYNIRNLQKTKYRKFWFFQLIAMSIHLGAAMYLIAWVLQQLKFSRRAWVIIIGACFIVGIAYPFGAILKSLPGVEILSRVQNYSQWGEYAMELGVLSNIATLKQLALCIILLIFYKRLKPHVKYFDIIVALYFASTCWLIVWNDFAIVGARMATFLSIGEPIIWSSLLMLVTLNSRKILLPLLIMVALLFLYTNMVPGKIVTYDLYPFFK